LFEPPTTYAPEPLLVTTMVVPALLPSFLRIGVAEVVTARTAVFPVMVVTFTILGAAMS
jgi:hypothetical protein